MILPAVAGTRTTPARLCPAPPLPAWRRHPHVPQSQRGTAPALPAAAAATRAVTRIFCQGWRQACGPPCAPAALRWDQPCLLSLAPSSSGRAHSRAPGSVGAAASAQAQKSRPGRAANWATSGASVADLARPEAVAGTEESEPVARFPEVSWDPQTGLPAPLLGAQTAALAVQPEPGLAKQVSFHGVSPHAKMMLCIVTCVVKIVCVASIFC